MYDDIYEGSIWRPPSEAYSLILQATVGCSWNKCSFCIAYKGKTFRIKTLDDIKRDVEKIYPHCKDTKRIFLADGNALCVPTDELEAVIKFLYSKFEKLERISIYGGPLDIKDKSVDELMRLKEAGLELVYFGLESGSDDVLKMVKKGALSELMIETGKKVKASGLKLSAIYILGLGGIELTDSHAIETARVISAMDPDYAAALTLMIVPGSDIAADIGSGRITLLNPDQTLQELRKMVEQLEVTNTIFRANHASNYAPIRGTLPRDKERILAQIDDALKKGVYKPELMRGL
ncbi:MAG: radical SAM protein [Thermoplasmata archaeon]|nr:radical SAM protein [Thermoplasmata archaeon]